MNVKLQWRNLDTTKGKWLTTGYMTVKAAMEEYKKIEDTCVSARLIYFKGYHDHVHKVLKERPKFKFRVEALVSKTIMAHDAVEAGEQLLALIKGEVRELNPDNLIIDSVGRIEEEDREAKDAGDAQDPNFN